jgi:hypothetical protein
MGAIRRTRGERKRIYEPTAFFMENIEGGVDSGD